MSQIKLTPNATGSGVFTLASPATNTNRTLTLPDSTGTVLNDVSSLPAANLTGDVNVARLVSAFSGSNVSLTDNGYQKLPSGLIIQWGIYIGSMAAGTTNDVIYPVSFTTAVFYTNLAVQSVGVNNQISTPFIMIPGIGALSKFQVINTDTDSPLTVFRWLSIGF